ncbi:MAG: S-layer homology domain-containing protein [Acidimicrobiales bacterium]|nr:S-layer homology domain-containing protein [Acidimicrobiales bacterium]
MKTRRLRSLAFAGLVAGMLALPATPATGVAGFGDVAPARYFTDAVQWMVDEDITTGTSETCFSPEDAVTRGEAAAFLWRMKGEPAAAPHPFGDVTAAWQQGAVSWMFALGITTGTTSTTYSPDDSLTRGQIAALLHRLAGEPGAAPHPFSDVSAPWQQIPVSWMFANGITVGTSATTFSPDTPVTRGQVATFLYRYEGEPEVEVDPTHPTSPQCAQQVAGPNAGYNSLFIGHSFFIPVAGLLPALAADAGLVDHTQEGVFSGGASGAPQAMWENASVRAGIQASLDSGDIELFGMTYHPVYPTLEGYRLWIDYALAQNPHTVIMVGLPWSTNPGAIDAATYASTWHDAHETGFHPVIDDLRDEYPGVVIFEIGYGHAATELYERFDAGELPGIDTLVRSGGPGVFSDSFGHADAILRDLAAHVWLRAIYGVPLSTLDDPGYEVDLREIADEIMDAHDPDYNAP